MASSALLVPPVVDDLPLSPIQPPHFSPEASILLFVAVPGSPPTPLRVHNCESITAVKLRIQHSRGFVVKKQKLVFHGRELARSDSLIREYGVAEGNILHLLIRLSDVRLISIETAEGKLFECQVEHSRSVGFLKERISEEGEDLGDEHKLVFNGQELDDSCLITDICQDDKAVIHLLIRKSAKVRTTQVGSDVEISVAAALNDLTVSAPMPARVLLVEPVVGNQKITLPPAVVQLIRSTAAGLENGYQPVMSTEGSGGAYFMRDADGRNNVAVFKPVDEEPMAENNPRGLPLSVNGEGLKKGTRVGEGALREVAAYILDHPIGGRRRSDEVGFSGVPPTVLVQCLNGSVWNERKIGSLQMFVKNNGSCEDMGPAAFRVEEVHKIAVLDIRLANADRHAGNILVVKDGNDNGSFKLIPIDHGYCLPEMFEDCTFEWLNWRQAREPFSAEVREYINSLDAEQDIALLKYYGWEVPPKCAQVLRVCTMLLKKGASRGLSPYDIGRIICRETLRRESRIEAIVREAEDAICSDNTETAFIKAVSAVMDRHLNAIGST